MLTKVLSLEKRGGLRLHVRFSDGSEGVHDFTAMFHEPGPLLEPLRDEAYFARVLLDLAPRHGRTASTLRRNGFAAKMPAARELSGVAAE